MTNSNLSMNVANFQTKDQKYNKNLEEYMLIYIYITEKMLTKKNGHRIVT